MGAKDGMWGLASYFHPFEMLHRIIANQRGVEIAVDWTFLFLLFKTQGVVFQ